MEITYSQPNTIKIVAKSATVVINPSSKVRADAALWSEGEDKQIDFSDTDTTVFDCPGEYEVKGCMIDAVDLGAGQTAYSLGLEDLRVVYLAAPPEKLSDSQLERLGSVDVLCIGLAGRSAEETGKLLSELEPSVVLPINYTDSSLQTLTAETGTNSEKLDKLKLTKRDLPETGQRLVVLSSQG